MTAKSQAKGEVRRAIIQRQAADIKRLRLALGKERDRCATLAENLGVKYHERAVGCAIAAAIRADT